MGKEGCLGAGWDAEYEGMLSFTVGFTGGEFLPVGAAPLSACVLRAGPTCQHTGSTLYCLLGHIMGHAAPSGRPSS
jgi:hypothetical protein